MCNMLLFAAAGWSQTEVFVSETGGENNPTVYSETNYQYDPCTYVGVSNAFENGKSCTQNLARKVANDFIVPQTDEMTLTIISANIFIGAIGSGVNAAFVDYTIYDDAGGEPGDIIAGDFSFVPTNQTVIGNNFGFDVWDVELDIPDVQLPGGGGAPITYWVGLSVEATDGSNVFWENTTADITGAGEAYDDGTGTWFIAPNLDGVYTFTGDCSLLGIVDNYASAVQLYPNPISGELITIQTPIPGEKQIVVFDILGKKVIDTSITNNQMNVSSLSGGVYMLHLSQNDVSAIKKLVIR